MVSPIDRTTTPTIPPDPFEAEVTPAFPLPAALDDLKDAFDTDLLAHDDPEHHFKLATGTPLGFEFCEKTYAATDAFIQDSPVRKPLEQSWREKAGMLHLGGALYSFLPLVKFLGGGFGVYFGFSADAALRYRVLQPDSSTNLKVPYTPALALKMPAGSEFEIIGQIRSDLNSGLYLYAGETISAALFGAALFSQGGIEFGKEVGLSVLSLDEEGHVRITLRRVGEKESNLSLGIAAGCIIQFSQVLGRKAGGITEVLPSNSSTRDSLDLISGWASSTLGMSHKTQKGNMNLASFDLDLKSEAAQSIYRKVLLMQLEGALRLASQHPECASVALSSEMRDGNSLDAGLNFFTETLFDASESKHEIKGLTALPHAKPLSYKDRTFAKTKTLWSNWHQEVTWQEVKGRFFHFQFKKDAFRYSKKNFHQFLRFADGLGVERSSFVPKSRSEADALETKLSKAAKVSLEFDIFFTKEGIEKILNASSLNAQRAFILAAQATDSDYADSPLLKENDYGAKARRLLDEYEAFTLSHYWDVLQITKKAKGFHSEYKKLTGRTLSMDYGLFKRAQDFAKTLQSGHKKKDGTPCAFGVFTKLAAKNKSHFEKTIAALANLAGRAETRIHTFSLESHKLKLASESEEALSHPREEILRHLATAR